MSGLSEYLHQKREAVIAFEKNAAHNSESLLYQARVRAAGRSGVREIRIRDFQLISDSDEAYAGHNLGPSSPEMQLGVLGSCITHITLIQASLLEIELDSVEVHVSGNHHPLAGKAGYEHIPIHPHNISYIVELVTKESDERVKELHLAVEQSCPILQLLREPQTVQGTMVIVERADS